MLLTCTWNTLLPSFWHAHSGALKVPMQAESLYLVFLSSASQQAKRVSSNARSGLVVSNPATKNFLMTPKILCSYSKPMFTLGPCFGEFVSHRRSIERAAERGGAKVVGRKWSAIQCPRRTELEPQHSTFILYSVLSRAKKFSCCDKRNCSLHHF